MMCEKLVKEEVIRFWELSGSPSGSSGSLNSLKEDNSKSYGQIPMKFSGHVQNGTRKGFFIIGRWGYFPHMCVGELSCLDESTLPWQRSALSECSCYYCSLEKYSSSDELFDGLAYTDC